MAFRIADVSTSNGSSSFEVSCGAEVFLEGADFAVGFAAGDSVLFPAGLFPEGCGLLLGLLPAGFGFPDIDAPQNGQSSTSSSRTEASQAGHLRKSMILFSG